MGNTESSAATVNNVPSSLDKIPLPPSSEVLDDSTESGSDVAQQSLREGEVQVANAVQDVGYMYLLKNGYSDLVNLIIRPPRAQYATSDLGPMEFEFGAKNFFRRDFNIKNRRGLKLVCSHWQPTPECRPRRDLPCLIYLHGNASCRVEALSILRLGLALGVTVLAFDFSGCGLSEGEYISLGYYERDDVQTVMEYLRRDDDSGASTIGIWGRSMGAASALLHVDRDPSIAAVVLDSAFSDLERLARELVEIGRQHTGLPIPHFVVHLALKAIRHSVMRRAAFDIQDLCPVQHAPASHVPALFIAAEQDTFIPPHHSAEIFDQYGGEKNFIRVSGDHNSNRPRVVYDSALIFLQQAFHLKDPQDQLNGVIVSNVAPWIGKDLSWTCLACTLVNTSTTYCDVCGTPRISTATQDSLTEKKNEHEDMVDNNCKLDQLSEATTTTRTDNNALV